MIDIIVPILIGGESGVPCATTFSIMTLSIMTFSIMTLSIMTLSIMTFSITTLSIKDFLWHSAI